MTKIIKQKEIIRVQKKVIEFVPVEKTEEVTMNLKEYIGYNLMLFRDNLGLSQEEFAESIGVIRTSLSNIENGRQGLTVTILRNICKKYNCKSSDVLPF